MKVSETLYGKLLFVCEQRMSSNTESDKTVQILAWPTTFRKKERKKQWGLQQTHKYFFCDRYYLIERRPTEMNVHPALITTRPRFLFQPFVLSPLQTKADAISPAADSRDKTHNHEHMCRNRAGCAHTRAESSPRTHFILCKWTRSALKPEISADVSVGAVRGTHLQIVMMLLLLSLMTQGSLRPFPLSLVQGSTFFQHGLGDLGCVGIKGCDLTLLHLYLTDSRSCTLCTVSASIGLLRRRNLSISYCLADLQRRELAPVIFQLALNISDRRFSRWASKTWHFQPQPCTVAAVLGSERLSRVSNYDLTK